VLIHGGHFGTDDFSTYLDISGCEGHSVLSIYLDMSGTPGQGGIVDFNTYFDGSGTGHGAGGTALFIDSGPSSSNFELLHAHFGFGFPHP
jgi:hypothetical protein